MLGRVAVFACFVSSRPELEYLKACEKNKLHLFTTFTLFQCRFVSLSRSPCFSLDISLSLSLSLSLFVILVTVHHGFVATRLLVWVIVLEAGSLGIPCACRTPCCTPSSILRTHFLRIEIGCLTNSNPFQWNLTQKKGIRNQSEEQRLEKQRLAQLH